MAMINNGDGMYAIINGVEEELVPTSYAIDRKRMYQFDQNSGVLKVNREILPEGALEKMSKAIIDNPEGITVNIPILLSPPARLQKVKEVRYLSEAEIRVVSEDTLKTNKPKYGFLGRLFNRI
ncbi:MAG TPA: hypothetical protein VJH92_05700 [Candidatus Nanoarchaeia archaeon]|nr:hypothetical protein [Candidatus Nanoarchaeia archaeon]